MENMYLPDEYRRRLETGANLPDGIEMMMVCTDPGMAGKKMADYLGIPHVTPTRCKAWREEHLAKAYARTTIP